MWFWVFMTASCMLVPVLVILFGKLFAKKAPPQINHLYGYRTKMSRLNMDTWNYAHHFFGRLWFRMGCVMLPGTVFCMVLLYGRDENTIGTACSVLVAVQVVLLIVPLIRTERELHRIFDAQGRRRE